jgi:hypothetical protein
MLLTLLTLNKAVAVLVHNVAQIFLAVFIDV